MLFNASNVPLVNINHCQVKVFVWIVPRVNSKVHQVRLNVHIVVQVHSKTNWVNPNVKIVWLVRVKIHQEVKIVLLALLVMHLSQLVKLYAKNVNQDFIPTQQVQLNVLNVLRVKVNCNQHNHCVLIVFQVISHLNLVHLNANNVLLVHSQTQLVLSLVHHVMKEQFNLNLVKLNVSNVRVDNINHKRINNNVCLVRLVQLVMQLDLLRHVLNVVQVLMHHHQVRVNVPNALLVNSMLHSNKLIAPLVRVDHLQQHLDQRIVHFVVLALLNPKLVNKTVQLVMLERIHHQLDNHNAVNVLQVNSQTQLN